MANLCTNPGFESDTTGWSLAKNTETLTRVTSGQDSGVACGEVSTPGGVTAEGIYFNIVQSVVASDELNVRIRAKGSGVVRVWAATLASGLYKDFTKTSDVTLTGSYQTIDVSVAATQSADAIRLEIRTTENQAAQAVTFNVDNADMRFNEDLPSSSVVVRLPLLGVGT